MLLSLAISAAGESGEVLPDGTALLQSHVEMRIENGAESQVHSATTRVPTQAEKEEFVKETNKFRCMHGVDPVVWSDAMAADAENYIAGMTTMKHSNSYGLQPPAGPAGENLYWTSHGSADSGGDAVSAWYSEVNDCKGGPSGFTDGCADGGGKATGHFTALVWKGVKEIGCAFSDSVQPMLVICRYKAGDTLSLDTPNMNKAAGWYKNMVFPRSKTEAQCTTKAPEQPDEEPEESGEEPAEEPEEPAGEPGEPEEPVDEPAEPEELGGEPGLHAKFYYFTQGNTIPSLEGKAPDVTRTDAVVNYKSTGSPFTGLTKRDHFAAAWTGAVVITKPGKYTFTIESDDGSRLFMEGKRLIDNDGLHGMRRKEGTATLAAGQHHIELIFFEKGGGAGMIFYYSGPDTGGKRIVVPQSALTTEAAEPTPGSPTEAPTLPPTEAATAAPTKAPTAPPTEAPTATPTKAPSAPPSNHPMGEEDDLSRLHRKVAEMEAQLNELIKLVMQLTSR